MVLGAMGFFGLGMFVAYSMPNNSYKIWKEDFAQPTKAELNKTDSDPNIITIFNAATKATRKSWIDTKLPRLDLNDLKNNTEKKKDKDDKDGK